MLALLGLRPDKFFQKKKKKKRKPFPLETKGKAVKVFEKKNANEIKDRINNIFRCYYQNKESKSHFIFKTRRA